MMFRNLTDREGISYSTNVRKTDIQHKHAPSCGGKISKDSTKVETGH
jgi:hypothetical protein